MGPLSVVRSAWQENEDILSNCNTRAPTKPSLCDVLLIPQLSRLPTDRYNGQTMFHGELIGICVAERKGEPLVGVERADAVVGRGLVGDRHFLKPGANAPDREITLIESEALDGLAREYQVTLQPVQTRRNLVTRGVPLNHLVGRDFTVGT